MNSNKAKKKFCLSSHCNGGESDLYVNETKIYNFKANDNMSWYNFCLRIMSKDLSKEWRRY